MTNILDEGFECFVQNQTTKTVSWSASGIRSSLKTVKGLALREIYSPHKKMVSTANTSMSDVPSYARLLRTYDRPVHLVMAGADETKELAADADDLDWIYSFLAEVGSTRSSLELVLLDCIDCVEIFGKAGRAGKSLHRKLLCLHQKNHSSAFFIFPLIAEAGLQFYKKRALSSIEEVLAAPTREPLPASYSIIFTGEAAAVFFHEIFGHGFQNGGYFCMHGQRLAAVNPVLSGLTVQDNDLANSETIDDEGSPKRPITVLEAGCNPRRLNGSSLEVPEAVTASSGNVRRSSYLAYPQERPYRTMVAEGTVPFGALLEQCESALLVENIVSAGINKKSWEVIFYTACARVIKDGQLGGRLGGITIKASVARVLQNIAMIANDSNAMAMFCHDSSGLLYAEASAPSVLVHSLFAEPTEPAGAAHAR